MGVPNSLGMEIGGDPVPLSFGDCPDRTRFGIGRGHAGSRWKTGVFGLREAEGLSSGWMSWWSLSYKIKSIPHMNEKQVRRTTHFIGIDSALSTSIAWSTAITADPTLEGRSTGVNTPELLKE